MDTGQPSKCLVLGDISSCSWMYFWRPHAGSMCHSLQVKSVSIDRSKPRELKAAVELSTIRECSKLQPFKNTLDNVMGGLQGYPADMARIIRRTAKKAFDRRMKELPEQFRYYLRRPPIE